MCVNKARPVLVHSERSRREKTRKRLWKPS